MPPPPKYVHENQNDPQNHHEVPFTKFLHNHGGSACHLENEFCDSMYLKLTVSWGNSWAYIL